MNFCEGDQRAFLQIMRHFTIDFWTSVMKRVGSLLGGVIFAPRRLRARAFAVRTIVAPQEQSPETVSILVKNAGRILMR